MIARLTLTILCDGPGCTASGDVQIPVGLEWGAGDRPNFATSSRAVFYRATPEGWQYVPGNNDHYKLCPEHKMRGDK